MVLRTFFRVMPWLRRRVACRSAVAVGDAQVVDLASWRIGKLDSSQKKGAPPGIRHKPPVGSY